MGHFSNFLLFNLVEYLYHRIFYQSYHYVMFWHYPHFSYLSHACSHPIDVVKTRLQVSGDGTNGARNYKALGIRGTVSIIATEVRHSRVILYITTMQNDAIECNTMRCNAILYDALEKNLIQWNLVQRNLIQCYAIFSTLILSFIFYFILFYSTPFYLLLRIS